MFRECPPSGEALIEEWLVTEVVGIIWTVVGCMIDDIDGTGLVVDGAE